MAVKRNYLYLYLTLVCFVGIIVIFILDGYMGVYDSLTITSGEVPYTIEGDQWPEDEKYAYYSSVDVEEGGRITLNYEVDNRRFSSYGADVEVSAWRNQVKTADLLTQEILLGSFDKGQLEWVLDMEQIVPGDVPDNENYEFTVKIKRADIVRNVIIYVRGSTYISKPVIAGPAG